MRTPHTAITLTLAFAFAVAMAATAGAEDKPQHRIQRIVIASPQGGADAKALPDPAQIPGDHLKIDDLDSLAAGESRSYTSEGGKEVTITRKEGAEARYTLQFGNQTIEIGGKPEHEMALAGGEGGAQKIVIRREVKANGEGSDEVDEETTGGELPDLTVPTGGEPPLVIDITGEQDGKATRRVIVLKVAETSERH